MGKIDEKIKGKRCSFSLRINPELRDAFRNKCKEDNVGSSDLVRSWMEHFTWGHKGRPEPEVKLNTGKRFNFTEELAASFDKACADMSLNGSAVIRSLVSDWLKGNGYEVDKK